MMRTDRSPSGIDPGRKWGPVVERLRRRFTKGHRSLPPNVEQTMSEAIDTCESLLQELAASYLERVELRNRISSLRDEWAYLFEAMPTACLVVDAAGTMLQSNHRAAELLNMSARHLENRVMTYFVQNRQAFLNTLHDLSLAAERVSATFLVRPYERGPLQIDMIAVPKTPGDRTVWLWFLTPFAASHALESL